MVDYMKVSSEMASDKATDISGGLMAKPGTKAGGIKTSKVVLAHSLTLRHSTHIKGSGNWEGDYNGFLIKRS
jgi:hypothetical protein